MSLGFSRFFGMRLVITGGLLRLFGAWGLLRFILAARGQSRNMSKPPESAAVAVDEVVGTFVRSVYTRSSVSTHTPTEREEVLRVHSYVRACLCELLEVHSGA